MLTATASAQKTWEGDVSTDYNTSGNWDGGQPGFGQTVVFDDTATSFTVTADGEAKAMSFPVFSNSTNDYVFNNTNASGDYFNMYNAGDGSTLSKTGSGMVTFNSDVKFYDINFDKTFTGAGTGRMVFNGNILPETSTNGLVFDSTMGWTAEFNGTWDLPGVDPVTQNGGTVLINGKADFAWNNQTWALNGGTLGGTGSIVMGNATSGSVLVNGGTLAPGQSVGTFSIGAVGETANLNLTSGTYEFEMGASSNDLVNVTGDLDIHGGTFSILDAGIASTGLYDLMTYTGSFSGDLTNASLSLGGDLDGTLVHNAGDQKIQLDVTVIPEPSTMVLLSMGLLVMGGQKLLRRRRR